MHARSTIRSNIESGSGAGAIGSGEDSPEPPGARRARAVDPIQGLADPSLARPSPERVVERLLDAIVTTHHCTEVAQRARDVRARDVVDPRVIAVVPHSVTMHDHAGDASGSVRSDGHVNDCLP